MNPLIEQLVKLFPDEDVMLIKDVKKTETFVQLRGNKMILQVFPSPEVSFHITTPPDRSAQLAIQIMKITKQEVKITKSFWQEGDTYFVGADATKKLFEHLMGKVKMEHFYEYLVRNENEGTQH